MTKVAFDLYLGAIHRAKTNERNEVINGFNACLYRSNGASLTTNDRINPMTDETSSPTAMESGNSNVQRNQ